MAGTPTTPTVPPAVSKPFTMAIVIAFILWFAHGVQSNNWTALPQSVSQALVDSIPILAAAAYTWVKHILRDKLGWNLDWLG